MKIPGIIGGLGPQSTIEYYRLIIAAYRERTGDGSYPSILVNSVDMQKVLRLVGANALPEVTAYLLAEVQRLAGAGAEFGALASNTPHLVFPALKEQSPIPLLSIVEVTCQAAARMGLKRLGLFGARFTMQGRFYADVFERAGIALVTPSAAEQNFLHDKYMNELLHGIIRPDTRTALLAIAERLRVEENIAGLILGGTELPLILRDVKDARMPFLDTTQLHVEAIVDYMTA
jgi:aspartate racemase